MLQRTEKIKNKSTVYNNETLAELLAKLGVVKVKSYPCTPTITAKAVTVIEEPPAMKI